MKRRLAILSFLICELTLMAVPARHDIHWQPLRLSTLGESPRQIMVVSDAEYADETGIPSIVTLVSGPDISITDPLYQPLTAEELSLVGTSEVPIPDSLQWQIISRTTNHQTNYYLQINPLVRIGGIPQKLVSYLCETHNESATARPKVLVEEPSSSALKSGKWYKIKVTETGIYKLSKKELEQMGVTASNVRIFGHGGAMLSEINNTSYLPDISEIPLWRGSDYVLFYAQGSTNWTLETRTRFLKHTTNPYSDAGYYFVTKDVGTGKTITTAPACTEEPLSDIDFFTDYILHEKDEVTLLSSGRKFYGEKFNASKSSYTFTHAAPNVLNAQAGINLNVVANASVASSFYAKVNGITLGPWNIKKVKSTDLCVANDTSRVVKFTSTPANTLNVEISYNHPNASAVGYLDSYELNYQRALKMVNSWMLFREPIHANISSNNYYRYRLTNASSNTEIWNVTSQSEAYRLPTQRAADTLSFVFNSYPLQEYVAVNPNGTFLSAEIVGQVNNQNLHALPMCDMVIIAHPDFMDEARRLADAHETYDDMVVHVVSSEEVYNEFSSGTPDATAYRRLMKMFYDRNTDGHQLYLLLFGDGHFDNKRILGGTDETHRLLTYQAQNSLYEMSSYVTDDYFALLDDYEGVNVQGELMDIGVGRLPIGTSTEASATVDKIVEYIEDNHKGVWKTKLCFLADDGDSNTHVKEADSVACHFEISDSAYQIKKIYLDAYKQETSASGESYPLAKTEFINLVKSGALMFNYTGHGGTSNWTNEAILTMYEIQSMYNKAQALWVAATCNFSHWDLSVISGGERLVTQPEGGAIATFSAARTVYSAQNYILNRKLSDYFFAKENGEHLRLGEIVRRAKNATGSQINKLVFTLLGDPALMLHYPDEYKVVTTSINDTINALGEVLLKGQIQDAGGNLATDFNGYIHVSVMDKEERVRTLANDAGSNPFEYTDRPNAIFKGKTAVNNGKWELRFLVPKDIKYAYGKGCIYYYATDESNGYDANGYFTKFIVGGESKNYVPEDKGPQVNLYLNVPTFRYGDKVNPTPLLVANLQDESGINTVGSGLGHDIIMRLDDNNTQTVLNEYYEADFGTYEKGTVLYKMPAMEEGRHTLFFRCWDLQNNSTTVNTAFVVEEGIEPSLSSVVCYPNPTRDVVYFVYEHNLPEEIFDITATVYDIHGQTLWSTTRTIMSETTRTEPIMWNLRNDNGRSVTSGLYILRMQVGLADGKKKSLSAKIVVL